MSEQRILTWKTFRKYCGLKRDTASGIECNKLEEKFLNSDKQKEYGLKSFRCLEGNCPVWKHFQCMDYGWW